VVFVPVGFFLSFFFFRQRSLVFLLAFRHRSAALSLRLNILLASRHFPSTVIAGSALVHRWVFSKTRSTFLRPTWIFTGQSTITAGLPAPQRFHSLPSLPSLLRCLSLLFGFSLVFLLLSLFLCYYV
jgi:hypothetical protein